MSQSLKSKQSNLYQSADIKLGGLLYDNWPKLKGLKFEKSHPLYPSIGRKSGTVTWRCKECHGWDYLGRDGRYGSGLHYTGIKGIFDARNKSVEELYKDLTDTAKKHDFSEYLKREEIYGLIKFIRAGLIDMKKVISYQKARGNINNGRLLYNKMCAQCHGRGGKVMDFKSEKEDIQGVGWLANENPQETLHKIRWGHPGTSMPSAVVDYNLSDNETVDVLTYIQHLQ